jgi:membrane protein
MAFYHFLAIFPALLVFLAISARVPHLGDAMKAALQDACRQVLPDQVARLFQRMTDELNGNSLSGIHLIPVCAGALWAALNGTWAMVYGLNRAYEVEESRSGWQLGVTIVSLTFCLAVTGCLAMFLIFYAAHLHADLSWGLIALRVLQWLVLAGALLLSFGVLYRFAPNVRDPEWRWSTPGAVCALVLWIGCTLAARVYFDRVDDYSKSYGHLNSVAMLLLWLYVTNGAILIGGEMNSEIEKAVGPRH